jgi:hypothetical protein
LQWVIGKNYATKVLLFSYIHKFFAPFLPFWQYKVNWQGICITLKEAAMPPEIVKLLKH